MTQQITRRRVIRLSAAAAGLALLPFRRAAAGAAADLTFWRGQALGAVASLQIHHPDRDAAQRLIERCVAEVRRLEEIFSLYRDTSELTRLNKHGALAAPSRELVELLSISRHFAAQTDGAFDVTVQPLWDLYVQHFTQPDAAPDGPAAEAVAAALARVGSAALFVNRDRVAFARHGMAVTLNGIAQGYITDRIVDLLRAEGITQTLVDMGETRCLDSYPDGRPWQVGIADPERPGHVRQTLAVVNQAVATSGSYGFQFDRAGRFNHLFNPKTGGCCDAYKSVTVVAPTATAADALSTAFSLMPLADIERVSSAFGKVTTHLIMRDGTLRQLPIETSNRASRSG